MANICVLVADAAKARLFTLEAADMPDVQSGPNLIERDGLANPEGAMPGRDKYSDVHSGRTTSGGGTVHGVDDHRNRHDAENERRFAVKIVDEATRLATQQKAWQLVVVAEKQMLGVLRQAFGSGSKPFEIRELAKNLANFSPTDIHSHLADEKILPAHRRAKIG